ncbi:hypothetical protein [Cytobacillus massiliigabonensis]|uniref:hypothetical protein n=1 Tax=Cytobacillus massiliigabonensis TaxID=1871011 RepID=UPI0015E0F177|nr:hypothetical protein [Cytobacillus massiliigabonensis]
MKRILTVLFAMIILNACSNEEIIHYEYRYIGEGEYWEAEYVFKGTELWGEENGRGTYSNENNDELVLKYKGSLKDLSSVKKLEYSYETSAGSGSNTREFDHPPNGKTFKSAGSSKNGAKVNENEMIQVHVKWDDYEESFKLYNKK